MNTYSAELRSSCAPRARYFWPRTIALQLLMLRLWWTVFYQPSLILLRLAAQIPFALFTGRQDRPALAVDAAGEWKVSIPVGAVVRDSSKSKGPVAVDAIDFSAPAANIAPFTTGWFVSLALALNMRFTRVNLRRTLIGLLLQAVTGTLGLFFYVEINAQGVVVKMHSTPDAMAK